MIVAFFGFLFVHVLAADLANQTEKCFTNCVDKNSCGIWLESDQESKSGLYSLKNSQLNVSCSFVSLPTTIEIEWQFRSRAKNQWVDATNCKQQEEHTCNATILHEHRTRSYCIIDRLSLDDTGSYRCQTKHQDEPSHSAESVVEVIGIGSRFEVVDKKLVSNEPGFIEIEICANPPPQLFFINKKYVLQPGHTDSKYLISSLNKSRQRTEENDEPGSWNTYCYNCRLIIGKVSSEDISWKVTAIVADDTQTLKLADQLDNTAIQSKTSFLVILLVVSNFL